MDQNQAFVVFDIVRGSLTGEMAFPDVVGRLMEVGVERYHADYSRQEKTFYCANGESLVVTVPYARFPTGGTFSVTKVQEAVRQSQRNEHTYLDFVEKTMAAGCVGYFVQITGRRALYFGRNGESHVELFPSEPVD
ncbi:DUF1398 family protein [bacterium]|nr:DUF1398 family protein [bacterium]